MSHGSDSDFKSVATEYIRYWLHQFSKLTQIDAQLIDLTIETYQTRMSERKPVEVFVPITRRDQVRPGVQIVAHPVLAVHGRKFAPLIVLDVEYDWKLKLVRHVVDEFPITIEEKTRFDEIKDRLSGFLEELVRLVVAQLVIMAISRTS